MPPKSERQRRLMAKACNDAAFAKEQGISQKVACEFIEASERKRERRNGSSSGGANT